MLGPVWQLVHTELDRRAAAAHRDRKVLDDLLSTARAGDRALTERFSTDPRAPLAPPDVGWKVRWSDDPGAWLDADDLTGSGPVIAVRVAADHEGRAAALTGAVASAWAALDEATEQLDSPQVADVLGQIETLVEHEALDGSRCPVCGSTTDWRGAARLILGRVQDRRARVDAVRTASAAVADWVDGELLPLVTALDGGPLAEVEAFRTQVRHGGHALRPALRRVTDHLAAALAGSAHAAWLGRVRAASDAAAEWAAARRALVADLVAAWRDRGRSAADADGWRSRRERSRSCRSRTDSAARTS